MFLLCFYLIIEQWTHLTREFEQRIYTIHFSCNLVNFGGSKNHFHRKEMWNLKIHTIIHMRSVYILYSNEICECALWSHGGEKTLKLSAHFFLKKYSKTKTGSFKTQIRPKVELPTSPFRNWPPSQNVTVDKFQNTSIPSSKTFLATTTW